MKRHIGIDLAVEGDDGPLWFWIGSHAEYDRIIRGQ